MTEKKSMRLNTIVKPGELKLLFVLFFLASLLLNLYFIVQANIKSASSAAVCASSQFVYCINGECKVENRRLNPQEAEALKRKIELELKKAEEDFQRMHAWHEKMFQDLWW